MKKLKLVMSIATMCLAIAVLCFGVLAATSVTYTIEGTISYDVEDVYVDVNTTVYKSEKYLSLAEQNALLDTLGNPNNLSSAKTTYGLTEIGVSNSFSTLNTESPTPLSDLALTFNKDVKTYAIVVNVKNLTAKNAWAVVDSRTSTSTNVQIVDNYQLNIAKDGTGKNVVIIVTPTDVTQPIASGTFTFNFVFGSGNYVDSTTNTSKMIIAEDKSVTKASDDISGVLEIPGDCVIKDGQYVPPKNLGAFSETKIFHVILNDGITSIGEYAFYGCSSLTSITIPTSLTSITGYDSFAGCSNLKSVYITDLESWYNISYPNRGGAPTSANPLCNGSDLYLNGEKVTSVTIPSSLTTVKSYIFNGCTSLTSVIIPEGITEIGYYAFSGCSSLTSITIPSSVTSIGGSAFSGCSSLTNITIPSNVTSIGSSAFSGCSGLVTAKFEVTSGWWSDYITTPYPHYIYITLEEGLSQSNAEKLTNSLRNETWTRS